MVVVWERFVWAWECQTRPDQTLNPSLLLTSTPTLTVTLPNPYCPGLGYAHHGNIWNPTYLKYATTLHSFRSHTTVPSTASIYPVITSSASLIPSYATMPSLAFALQYSLLHSRVPPPTLQPFLLHAIEPSTSLYRSSST